MHDTLDPAGLMRLLEPIILELEAARFELAEIRKRHDAPVWAPGVYRQGAYVQHFMGQIFEAAADTALEPGDGVAWIRRGVGGFRYRGLHVDGAEYTTGDLVTKDGSIMVETGQGLQWMALRGRRGPPGPPADPPPPGAPGAPGAPGPKGDRGAMVARFETERGVLYAVWDDGRRDVMAMTAIGGAP